MHTYPLCNFFFVCAEKQTIVHFYGDEDDEGDTSAEQLREHVQEELSSRKGCNRCGSLTHKRSTH